VHDSKLLAPLVDAVQPIRRPTGEPGRPRKRPAKLHADKGYDYPTCRRALRQRGITPRIARRGVESSERLGRHRWIVERTQAWVVAFRKLAVRYDRHAASVLAFLHLACALICLRFLAHAEANAH
jgi:IS5 family transposase